MLKFFSPPTTFNYRSFSPR